MIALGLTLLFPLVGILLLGCIGHWRCAGGVNLVISTITFAAALFLAINIFQHGPILSTGKHFYIDAFNVYLILLNAFVLSLIHISEPTRRTPISYAVF